MEHNQQKKKKSKQNITRDIEIKNNLTVTRGDVEGDNGEEAGKGFQEQLYRTHGQNQEGVEAGEGGGDGWGWGERKGVNADNCT